MDKDKGKRPLYLPFICLYLRFADWANLLFEQALLAEGGQLEDPASFVRRLNGLLAMLPS